VGLRDESAKDALDRQKRESEFKKTVNEIREEDDLDPLPGMDEFIMSAVFLQWYQQFSGEAQKMRDAGQQTEMAQDLLTAPEPKEEEAQSGDKPKEKPTPDKASVEKAIEIAYYNLPKE